MNVREFASALCAAALVSAPIAATAQNQKFLFEWGFLYSLTAARLAERECVEFISDRLAIAITAQQLGVPIDEPEWLNQAFMPVHHHRISLKGKLSWCAEVWAQLGPEGSVIKGFLKLK